MKSLIDDSALENPRIAAEEKDKGMITFRLADPKERGGVPSVEIMDEAGRLLGVIYVEDGERSIGVMSKRLDGPFVDSIKFVTGDGKDTHPTVVINFARK